MSAASRAPKHTLLSAQSAEEIEGLEAESNRYVELAEQCARELAVQRADAAGLRAEVSRRTGLPFCRASTIILSKPVPFNAVRPARQLTRTETDEKRKAAELAEGIKLSQLGSEGKIAAKSLSLKDTEARLLSLQVSRSRAAD
eukprot:SAG22_NODE_1648_length_3898_cov_6.783890_1_plen_143_part_00